jgi:Putative translation initiation inhibitor, yjgF family
MNDKQTTATTITASPRLDSVYTPEAPKGRGPFPQGVRYGEMLFVSGTGPLDPQRNEPDVGSFEHEVELTMRNLAKIAGAAGCSLADAVKLTVYLTDLANVPEFNAIYRRHFRTHLPARTLVQVSLRGIQVEIDGIFACPSRLPETDGDAAEAAR